MFSVLYLPPNLYPIGIARWLKAEFLHCSRIGGSVILVDLLSGCGVGAGEVGTGFVIGVGSGESWAGLVAGVGGIGKLGGYKVGDGLRCLSWLGS